MVGTPLEELLRTIGMLPLTGQTGIRLIVPVNADSELVSVIETVNSLNVSTDTLVREACMRLKVKGDVLDPNTGSVTKKYDENGNLI